MIKGFFGIFSALLALIGLDICYALYEENNRPKKIKNKIERGSYPVLQQRDAEEFLLRPSIQSQIVDIFKTSINKYSLITGEHGTGKTTLVKLACNAVGGGVVYVDVPSDVEYFPTVVAEALDYDFSKISVVGAIRKKFLDEKPINPSQGIKQQWREVETVLVKAARDYTLQHKKPPVIVLDNINYLAKDAPNLLELIQRLAKTCADEGILTFVFVSSEGAAPQLLQSHSSWASRARPPFEIGDVTDAEAISYLTNNKMEKVLAEQVVKQITGGRMWMLRDALLDWKLKVSYQDIEMKFMEMAEKEFTDAGLLDKTPQREQGLRVIKSILQSPTKAIPLKEFNTLVDPSLRSQLLRRNVFAYHPATRTITMQSRACETFAKTLD